MTEEVEKRDVWSIDVIRRSVLKVVFAEPLTKEEAIEAFDNEEYEDIIDDEDFGMESIR